jgi:hypothetical protein
MDGGYFSAHLSKLKKILRRELGPAAEAYLISDGGSRPRRYSLGLRPTAVTYDALETAEGVRVRDLRALHPTPRLVNRKLTSLPLLKPSAIDVMLQSDCSQALSQVTHPTYHPEPMRKKS